MSSACQKLADQYVRWLKNNISVAEVNGVCEIVTPFLDRHNDRLQIYVQREGEDLLLTDDAYIINDLELSGCNLDTPHRKRLLSSILMGFGVQLKGHELVTRGQADSFPQRKHALLQAMIAVNDLFAVANPTVRSLFLEDVAAFLGASGVRYAEGVQFTGKSGFAYKFEFLITRSSEAPERLVKTVNVPEKSLVMNVIWSWTDIRVLRDGSTRMYAFLNDMEKEVAGELLDAFKPYDITPVPWSQRDRYRDELAA